MRYLFMRYPEGKAKALTLSYDDGPASDRRLLEILNRYGLKCTFNLCEEHALSVGKIKKLLLEHGHEIAVHGARHRAPGCQFPLDGIQDVLDGRRALERQFRRIVRGMAYPDSGVTRFENGADYATVRRYLSDLGIAYARTLGGDNDRFRLPEDWYAWTPTAHHGNPRLMEYARQFTALDVENVSYSANRYPRLFCLWGHSFEFDREDNWDVMEDFCREVAGREDIWYATNIGICDYAAAFRSLERTADWDIVYNPTATKVWFSLDGKLHAVAPGETLFLDEQRG